MSPKQKKLAAKAPPPNKLDEKDFKVLREEKAKGRGMGLQDEKVQPGKVIKAKDSKFIERRKILSNMSEFQKRRLKLESKKIGGVMKARKGKSAMVPLKKGYSKTLGVFPTINKVKPSVGGSGSGMGKGTDKVSTKKAEDFMKRRKKLAGSKLPGKIGTVLGIGSMMVPAAYAAMKQYKDYKSAKNRDKAKVKKMGGGMMKKYSKGGGADSGRIGEMKSRLAVAQDKLAGGFRKARGKVSPRTFDKITERTKTYALAQSMKDKDRLTDRDIKKASSLVKGKMGGGMMQKPMGYRSGMGPAGAAGPSAGRPGGRRPMQQGPKGGIGSMPKKRDGIEIIVMTKDGPKRITRSELDGMSAIEQKMGGGMMKARRGRIVDDQKRDKRNPNRKPSTKIFDKIGDILKTPYYIRGGKKEKKMGGGMIGQSQRPGYSKGTMVKARGCKLGRTRPTKIT